MYYGETVFISHPSVQPIYKNGCTYLFGRILYSVSKGEAVTIYCGYKYGDVHILKSVVEGVIEYDFKYTEKLFGKAMTDSQHNEIVDAINDLLSVGVISDKCNIAYPYEEKYGILVLKNELEKDCNNVWVQKEFTPKYGQVVFEAAMQEWLGGGYTYFKKHNGIVELTGTVYSILHEGDVLMLIDKDTDTNPKLFCIREIIFREKRVDEADPAMRVYCLIMTCDCDVNISERAKFVKYS